MSFFKIATIGLKELRVYLTTWTSYAIAGAFHELNAFFFYILVRDFQLKRLQYASSRAVGILEHMNLTDFVVGPTFSYIATFFVFLLPVVTMRLFAEQKRQGSLELLLSAPISSFDIVVGKYLGAWTVMAGMLLGTVVFPISLYFFAGTAELDWRTIATGYLGMVLLGSAGIAVGLLSSALAESQVVAVVMSFTVLLVLLVIGVASGAQTGITADVLGYLSLSSHLNAFTRGMLRGTDVVYYLSLVLFCIYATVEVVERSRQR